MNMKSGLRLLRWPMSITTLWAWVIVVVTMVDIRLLQAQGQQPQQPTELVSCIDRPCIVPLAIPCEELVQKMIFLGSCCYLEDVVPTGGCRVSVFGQGNCLWVPRCENDAFCESSGQCFTEFRTNSVDACPTDTYEVLSEANMNGMGDEELCNNDMPPDIPTVGPDDMPPDIPAVGPDDIPPVVGEANTVTIDWRVQQYGDIVVAVGDTIEFVWSEGLHDVHENPEQDCNKGPESVLLGSTSPVQITYTEDDVGKSFYYACHVGGHCNAGMHILVNVLPVPPPPLPPPPPPPLEPNNGCMIRGATIVCSSATSIAFNGPPTEINTQVTCPLDATNPTDFVQASQSGLCQCDVNVVLPGAPGGGDGDMGLLQDTPVPMPRDCDCYACPVGSRVGHAFVCVEPLVGPCLTFTCDGECNGVVETTPIVDESPAPVESEIPSDGPSLTPSSLPTDAPSMSPNTLPSSIATSPEPTPAETTDSDIAATTESGGRSEFLYWLTVGTNAITMVVALLMI